MKVNTLPVSKEYLHRAIVKGFLEGYNTMDALAGLAFGVTVVAAVKQLVNNEKKGGKNNSQSWADGCYRYWNNLYTLNCCGSYVIRSFQNS